MEARDTVMSDAQIMEQTGAPMVLSGHRRLAQAARKAGIREVVEFIKETGYSQRRYYGNEEGAEDYFEIQFPWEKWQAKLKEWGIERSDVHGRDKQSHP